MKRINLQLPVWAKQAKPKLLPRKWRHNVKQNVWQRLNGRQRFSTTALALASCGVIMFGLFNDIFQAVDTMSSYELPSSAEQLLTDKQSYYSGFLHMKQAKDNFAYNEDYRAGLAESGQSARPKFRASFAVNPNEGVSVTDPVNETSIKLSPLFGLGQPRQELNRLIYPLSGRDGAKVVTLGSAGFKEDIVLYKQQGDTVEFVYELELPDGIEARIENDGSLGFYGVSEALLGDVSTGSEADAELLTKARQNGQKTNLLFKSPAPYVVDGRKNISQDATAWYSLFGNKLTLHASGLSKAKYPLSVDPSIYVETAAKLMRGNNETNVDFDVSNELIQKSQTTGARIDAWEDNLDMTTGTFDHNTAAAGGYVYRVGGRTGPSKPQVVDSEVSVSGGTDDNQFTMDMPATRPAGDLYIALICHDDENDSVTAPGGGGWTEYADLGEHAAYYKIGTDQGGGNESASYTWTNSTGGGGGNEEWAGVIIRVTNFNSADIQSGTPGTNDSSGVPQFPATTPDNNSTLVIRAIGADNDTPSDTGWVPTGHTKIASDTSSNTTGDCGFVAASLDNSPASGVSTGTATLADGSINDTYGGSSLAINPVAVTPTTEDSVHWAQFNSSTLAIESPNPGAGVCSGWCTDSAYDLPEPRRGFSMVAYNGYLYVLGGLNDSGTRESTVYIAKLGVNGEPSLWHPTDTNKNNWDYWYEAALNGPTAKSYLAAVAYNNRMYVFGGQTNASSSGVTTVERADILPNGSLGSWTTTGMQALPAGAGTHMHTVQVYNDTLYTMGGFEGAATSSANMRSSVYYSKLNSDGTMNAWQPTSGFTGVRSSHGGTMSAIWGAYIYIGGGCTAVNGSGYCTAMASDMQLASINADGTLDDWHSLGSLDNTRIGYSLITWQGGLYRLGGCTTQNTSTGECIATLADVDYGVVNPAGEVSTVNISVPSGTAPCSGGSPHSCDLPTIGDDAGEIGHMLNMSAILNGYLYVIGGCAEYNCNDGTNSPSTDNISDNTAYAAIAPDGTLSSPPSCGGTSYGAWCVDSTNTINGSDGVAAGGVTVFNGRIYVLGGIDSTGSTTGELYYNTPNATNGSISGWTTQTLSSVNIGEDIFYTYIYARANPSSAGTYPGNLYVFGGCGNGGSGAGCGASDYETEVYKCWIETGGAIENTAGSTTFDCTTTGQLQIDSTPGTGGTDGLGIHSGTVYANYIYLIGGYSQAESDKDDVIYARFDNNNNVVAASGGTWIESPNKLSVGRRRGWAFGYNGHIYAVGGYDDSGTGIIPFIEWAKINVSDGSIDAFTTSNVTINQRWGLSMAVSNSYAYVIGGCDSGASPSNCSSFEASLQTFQLYNNDSGAVNDFTAQSDQTFSANTDRWGVSSAVLNGYLYVAGGCVSATDCTDATNNVQYAPISSADGSIGTWASTTGALPADRAWGSLEVAGGSLYYVGGQGDTATDERAEVYYATPNTTANIEMTGLTSGTNTGASVNTASVAVAAGDLVVVAVGNYNSACGVASAALSGLGITWSNENIAFGGNCERMTYFWGVAPSSTSGALTISFSGQSQEDIGWAVSKVRGQRTTTPVAQDLDNSVTAQSSVDVSMAAAVNGSSIFITGSYFIPDAETGEGGYTTQYDFDTTFGAHIHVQYGDVDITSSPGVSGIDDSPGNAAAIVGLEVAAGLPANAGDTTIWSTASGGVGDTASQAAQPRTRFSSAVWNNRIYVVGGLNGSAAVTDTVFISPQLNSGGNIAADSWTEDSDDINVARNGAAMTAYANNLYLFGGHDGTNYLSDVQFTQINTDGTIDAWTYTTNLPVSLRDARAVSANGYIYLIGGRTAATTCTPKVLITPISANTTIATGNNPTGVGEWYETNVRFSGDRYGAAVAYEDGMIYTMGGGCSAPLSSNRHYESTVLSQPQVAIYSRLIDTDTDVFPNSWLMNGIDNSIGARWQVRYRSMNDTDGVATDCGPADMTTWGQETNYGEVTLGDVAPYVPLNGSGTDIDCARYFYFFISIDASRTFGYPEDVNRGPTIADITLFFTADPGKRLRHGKTFTGGEKQPLDTPCRQSVDSDCPMPAL